MPRAKNEEPAVDTEIQSARALLDEALGRSPSHRAPAPATAPLKAPAAASSGPVVKGLTLAPSGGGASQTWKSRRAKYSHLPPITVTLYHANQRAEVRVDERTRCGDLMRDLLAGGPSDGLLERLQLAMPRSTPRMNGVQHRITGLLKKGTPMHVRTVLEEGGEYEVAATEREVLVGSMEELMVGAPMRALGLAGDDSSDWSDDPDAEPC
jgi:hypothetical protein